MSTLNLDTIRRESSLVTPDAGRDLPALHERGVTLEWLTGFAKSAVGELSRLWQAHDYQERAALYFDHVPDPVLPPYPRGQDLTTHFLTGAVVRPITAEFAAPLYAMVPSGARGEPDMFLSHAWGNPLVGYASSELYALTDGMVKGGAKPTHVWCDVVSYNQHRPEAIAADMKEVIASIGRLGLPLFNTLPLTRLWCLWELLCAHAADAEIVVFEPNTSAHDLGLVANHFLRAFVSVDRAETTLPEDRDAILSAMVDTFGSITNTNTFIREVISTRLSSDADKPWNRAARPPRND